MKIKLIYVIITIIIICLVGFFLFVIFNKKDGEITNQDFDNNQVNLNDFNNSNFNFETKTVTLNSGYQMPLNGIGTYSLTGDTCYNAIRS